MNKYPMKNLVWTIIVFMYCILALLLTGCAGTELIVNTTERDGWYAANCMGTNSRYTQWDHQCQSHREPTAQYGQIHRQPRESELTEMERQIRFHSTRCKGRPCQPTEYRF